MKPKVFFAVPYYSGSHKYWADNICRLGTFNYDLETMTGRHWKWRMQGSAIHLAEKFLNKAREFDIILCSTMLDISLFKSIANCDVPIVYYMHENQLTYPYSDSDNRSDENFHYGFINYKSCLAADFVLFNSEFHRTEFLAALGNLLSRLPDYIDSQTEIQKIRDKSQVNWVGLDLEHMQSEEREADNISNIEVSPTLLWNHRWEHDKNPSLFLELCDYLESKNQPFSLILLGQDGNASYVKEQFHQTYASHIQYSGYTDNRRQYFDLLSRADILPVTSDHDFYGLSVLEAIYYNATPLLPTEKVYGEFIKESTYSHYYYTSKRDLFEKCLSLLSYPQKSIDKTFFSHHKSKTTVSKLESILYKVLTASDKLKV